LRRCLGFGLDGCIFVIWFGCDKDVIEMIDRCYIHTHSQTFFGLRFFSLTGEPFRFLACEAFFLASSSLAFLRLASTCTTDSSSLSLSLPLPLPLSLSLAEAPEEEEEEESVYMCCMYVSMCI
jgi:hypothetical protein